MRGDMGSLYDAHADRLYAYCWSLVGDRRAAAAVGDTFTAAVHHPPRGDRVLWLYSLSRTACAERDAFAGGAATGRAAGTGTPLFGDADPLLRAAGGLRSDHREVLLLWAGEWLEPHDIALVLGIAPDTVAQLLNAARARLERAVLDLLMRGTTEPRLDLISAFEKGRLPQLLARRAPSRAPAWLRDPVLAACVEETTRPVPSVVSTSPLVVIGAERARSGSGPGRTGRGLPGGAAARGGVSKGLGAAAGVAASAAAVIGLLASWPSAKGGGESSSLVPTAGDARTNPASSSTSGPQNPLSGLTGSERVPAVTPDAPAANPGGDPAPRGGGAPGTSDRSAPARPPGDRSGDRDPSRPPSTPPDSGSPTTPPKGPGPTTPPDDGSTDPTTPPTDPPTSDPGTPSPSPTTNPAPSPEASGG